MSTRKHLLVRGRVQGVCFRMYAEECAWRLDLRGWIRNRRDGRTVEAIVEGEPESVEAFVRWCHEGPVHAEVESVDVSDSDDGETFGGFGVRPTA